MDNTLMFQLWLIAEATEQLDVIIKTSQWAWQLKHQFVLTEYSISAINYTSVTDQATALQLTIVFRLAP